MQQKPVHLILEQNESIKEISEYAFKIRLRSINALILALKSGTASAGFAVVTTELIELSKKLMQLSVLMLQEVENRIEVNIRLNLIDRKCDLFKKAVANLKTEDNLENHSMIKEILDCENETRKTFETGDITFSKNLNKEAKQALLECLRGKAVAVQAKIEAAYVEGDRSAFTSVSKDVEELLSQAEKLLKRF